MMVKELLSSDVRKSGNSKELLKSFQDESDELKERKQRLLDQKQNLEERWMQITSESTSEINYLKKEIETLEIENKKLEKDKHCLLTEHRRQSQKFMSDLLCIRKEIKSFKNSIANLERQIEAVCKKIDETSAKVGKERELALKLKEEANDSRQILVNSVQESIESEVKYIHVKKELIEIQLNSTADRLVAEVTRMRQILAVVSKDTIPNEERIVKLIWIWDKCLKYIDYWKQVISERGKRVLWLISRGQPLNSHPLEDIPIPVIPEVNVVSLLNIFVPDTVQKLDKTSALRNLVLTSSNSTVRGSATSYTEPVVRGSSSSTVQSACCRKSNTNPSSCPRSVYPELKIFGTGRGRGRHLLSASSNEPLKSTSFGRPKLSKHLKKKDFPA